MRIISYILAAFIGFVLWGASLVLSGGVAPLGKAGPAEGASFFTPILAFALPLAVLAFLHGRALAGTWVLAMTPVFGFINFALAASAAMGQPSQLSAFLGAPFTLPCLWLALFGLVSGAYVLLERPSQHPGAHAHERP